MSTLILQTLEMKLIGLILYSIGTLKVEDISFLFLVPHILLYMM